MKIRKAKENSEHIFSEEFGEQIKCPVCKKAWHTDLEDDVSNDKCEHLRFFYCNDEFMDFYGDWDIKALKDQYDKIQQKMLDKEGCFYTVDAFKEINTQDIDEAIYVEFDYAPMFQPLGIWGYKRDGSFRERADEWKGQGTFVQKLMKVMKEIREGKRKWAD